MRVVFIKWIGGSLGWYLGGPLGGVLGFIAGSVIDSFDIPVFRKSADRDAIGEFAASLLILIASIMKADGKPLKAELDYVKHFLKDNFGEKNSGEALLLIRDLLTQELSPDNACGQVRRSLDYSSRLQFMHFLYNLANIDSHTSEEEQSILDRISRGLSVNVGDKRSVGTMLVQADSIIAAYATLGITRATSVIDIKKAYRSLAIKYHPDKVAYLGDDLKKMANEKFQQLTHAYEVIKKERNFV